MSQIFLRSTLHPLRPLLALTLLVLPLALLAGCGGADEGTAPETAEAPAEATETAETDDDGVRRYEVRGEVTAVPDPDDPLSNLVIRHEAIDDFESFEGEVVGMSSMSMPFPVAGDVDLEGVEVGDKVDFTLVVDWEGDPAYQVVRMEELPADTELELGKAQPPGGGGENGGEDAGEQAGDTEGEAETP